MKKRFIFLFVAFIPLIGNTQVSGLDLISINEVDCNNCLQSTSHNFSNSQTKDTNRHPRLYSYVGLQYLGTANNVLPFYGLEFKPFTKYSFLGQIGLGVDPNWRPPSFELVFKILNNYYFYPRFALNYGFGIEHRFNPWYMADPTSYNFVENCQFGWCPDATQVYFIDLGLQIALTKNLKWLLAPKYNYNLKINDSDFVLHFATLELKYCLG